MICFSHVETSTEGLLNQFIQVIQLTALKWLLYSLGLSFWCGQQQVAILLGKLQAKLFQNSLGYYYCWWKKSCTTWDVQNFVIFGIFAWCRISSINSRIHSVPLEKYQWTVLDPFVEACTLIAEALNWTSASTSTPVKHTRFPDNGRSANRGVKLYGGHPPNGEKWWTTVSR